MDPALILGIVLAFASLITMITLEGASISALILPAPMILVLGGTFGVGFASTTMKDALAALKSLPRYFLGKTQAPRAAIDQVVELAEIARKNGLLALEAEAAKIEDPTLKKALQNIADGVDADDLRIMLEDEAGSMERTGQNASKFFNSLGGFAPTIGIIGTVVSLTHVLENLDQPDTLGHSIAGAFVATLWGVMTANFLWLPIGGRITKITSLESERLTILIEGIMALQAGSQPRLLSERLLAMIPASEHGGARNAPRPDKVKSVA